MRPAQADDAWLAEEKKKKRNIDDVVENTLSGITIPIAVVSAAFRTQAQ